MKKRFCCLFIAVLIFTSGCSTIGSILGGVAGATTKTVGGILGATTKTITNVVGTAGNVAKGAAKVASENFWWFL